nr:precorrin-6y C5,15-methyltransferase (decarboxylating) subunit CbiE [uncultured Sellimonas sp.]
MKRKINLIGIGTDGGHSLTREAMERISQSTVLIGARRMINSVKSFRRADAQCHEVYQTGAILKILDQLEEEAQVSVLYSGDPGFYSGAKRLSECLREKGWEIQILPGIPSVLGMAARCQVPWEKAAFVSLHGEQQNVIHEICTHEHTFVLLGDRKTGEELLEKMAWYGLDHLEAAAGQNLSYEDERFFRGTIGEMTPEMLSGLSVLWVHHPEYQAFAGRHLEDEELIRGKVPMTKSAVRAMAVASLHLRNDAVLYDVGAGTGSVAVEAALQDGSIRVYAIERNPEGTALIRENKRKHRTDFVTIVEGAAPEALEPLPAPTHVFIGGSAGHMGKIIDVCLEKNPDVRIVLSAVSMETIQEVAALIREDRWETAEVMQIQASGSRKIGGYHLMTAQNPVFLAVLQGRKGEDHE